MILGMKNKGPIFEPGDQNLGKNSRKCYTVSSREVSSGEITPFSVTVIVSLSSEIIVSPSPRKITPDIPSVLSFAATVLVRIDSVRVEILSELIPHLTSGFASAKLPLLRVADVPVTSN